MIRATLSQIHCWGTLHSLTIYTGEIYIKNTTTTFSSTTWVYMCKTTVIICQLDTCQNSAHKSTYLTTTVRGKWVTLKEAGQTQSQRQT